jgi:hypothetical protein
MIKKKGPFILFTASKMSSPIASSRLPNEFLWEMLIDDTAPERERERESQEDGLSWFTRRIDLHLRHVRRQVLSDVTHRPPVAERIPVSLCMYIFIYISAKDVTAFGGKINETPKWLAVAVNRNAERLSWHVCFSSPCFLHLRTRRTGLITIMHSHLDHRG